MLQDSSLEESILPSPSAALGVSGIQEAAFVLELPTFAKLAVVFLHTGSMKQVVVIGQAKIAIQHHL